MARKREMSAEWKRHEARLWGDSFGRALINLQSEARLPKTDLEELAKNRREMFGLPDATTRRARGQPSSG
jgi:hypothetical protein